MLFSNTLKVNVQLHSCQRQLQLHVCHSYFHVSPSIENFTYEWCSDSLVPHTTLSCRRWWPLLRLYRFDRACMRDLFIVVAELPGWADTTLRLQKLCVICPPPFQLALKWPTNGRIIQYLKIIYSVTAFEFTLQGVWVACFLTTPIYIMWITPCFCSHNYGELYAVSSANSVVLVYI